MNNIIAYALYAISNDKSFALLKTIAITNKDEKGDSHTLRNKLKLTPKQYYSRISRLRKSTRRKEHGKYYLTAFGIVVYDARMVVENAINNYYKLAAVDSLVFSDSNNMLSLEDCTTNIIDSLIEDQQIKQFLIV